MQKNKQKLLSLLLTVVMVIGLLPMTAFAADDRFPISTVEATSTITPPVYGATIKSPSFTVTKGKPAYFFYAGSSASWEKKSGDSWETVYSGTFTEGTWRYRTQVKIDGSEGKTHVLAAPLNVRVNGELWTKNKTPSVEDTYSMAWVGSPEYTVTAPSGTPLTFTDNSGFDIPNNQRGKAITAYSVASYVSGGTKPYTFSKTSGPNWIAVSSAGQISGTPTTIGTNADLVVRVTDNEGAYEEITISVGNTIPKPGDRIPISTVEATSTITPPVYGATIKTPSFTVTQGSPAYFFYAGSSASWEKKSGDSWEAVYSGIFTEGTWRYRTQVKIDGSEGKIHVLAAPLNVRVNGELWAKNKTPSVEDTYSMAWVGSPEYTVTATPLVFADSTAYDIPAGTVGESFTASTALTASGGKLPYVFTVAPAVDGLSIGSDNKLVYTRPTVADAKTATIKVTDDLGASKTITINIGAVTAAPETTYALTVTNGTDKTGGSPYAAGTEVSITANDPASGKQFKEWTTSNGGTFASATSASTTFTMPDKDVTVTATYKDAPVTTYAVTVLNDGHGTASASPASAEAGTEITLSASPASGYVFKEWQVVSGSVTVSANKFTMPAGDVTVKAIFEEITAPTYSVTVQNDGNGTGSASPTSAEAGTEITLSASSASGYVFKEWQVVSGGVTVSANKFTMPAGDVTVKAVFEAATAPTYAVTVSSGTGSGNYAADATVSITANEPEKGKVFDKWTTTDGVTFGDANTATTTFVMPAKAVTVTATYKDISSETPDYKITAGENGIWKKGNTKGIVIISNGDYGDFTGVNVDGIFIDPSNYTSAAGSTVVTLEPAYLETLAVGTHIVTLQFGNYSVQTNLTILAADERPDESKPDESKPDESKPNEEIPKTGDSNHTLPLIGLLLLSGSALIGVTRNKKKKKSYNK